MTKTQAAVLKYLRRYQKKHKTFPKYQTVCEWFEWKSTHSATTVFKALHRMGFLNYDRHNGGYSLSSCCPFCKNKLRSEQ